MPNVWPMQPAGELEDSPIALTYSQRDPIGCEDPAASPADWTGWNEGADWTVRLASAWQKEHAANGLHHTQKIALMHVICSWSDNLGTYVTSPESWLQGSDGNIYEHGTGFTITRTGVGTIQVDLTAPLVWPSVNLHIFAFSGGGLIRADSTSFSNSNGNQAQAVRLLSVTSTSRLTVRNFFNGTQLDGGTVVFSVHDV